MERFDGRTRVVIEAVNPQIDCGRFPIKRRVGEGVVVEANAFADSHDVVACALCFRQKEPPTWIDFAMQPLMNDWWRGVHLPVSGARSGERYSLSLAGFQKLCRGQPPAFSWPYIPNSTARPNGA